MLGCDNAVVSCRTKMVEYLLDDIPLHLSNVIL